MGRGTLTNEVKEKAKELFGWEIDVTELRLIPYLLYCCVNSENIDVRKCYQAEREILSKWRKAGLIEGGASDLYVTRKMWDIGNEIMWIAYANL
jgi:hypothetical protein